MSQENVEIVRAFFEAALDGPEGPVKAYLADDLEFLPFSRMAGPSRGPQGFMALVADMADQFERYEVRPERLHGSGELVAADLRREAKTWRGSALIRDRFAQVLTLRDGKIARIRSFPSYAEALEAVGLSETARQGKDDPDV